MLMAYSITHRRARVRHPQSNGLVERLNRTVKERLDSLEQEQALLAQRGSIALEWDQLLQEVACSIRVSNQGSTQLSPYVMVFGRTPKIMGDEGMTDNENSPVEELLASREKIEEYTNKARKNIAKAQVRQQRVHMRRGGQQAVNKGDWILVRKRRKTKRGPIVDGPYQVIDIRVTPPKLKVENCPLGEWIPLSDAAPYQPRRM